MTHPISRFAVPDLETLPQDMQDAIAKVAEKSGFVPNVFLALAHRPDEFRAFFAYHQALMDKDEGLSKAEREMIVVAVSGLNNCQYCVVAHGAILRIRAKNALIADQVAVNWRKADLTDRQRAMLAYAEKVTLEAHRIGDADHQALRDAGFNINEIWDIGAIAAFFGMSNRMANAGDFRANDEFYMLGRQVPGLQ
ncbi:peroxidase-related enzyme [Paracoccus fontiphilus]|uniref:Peroxidase-related enzyme n=1 Tax=Paracoccus fontiphilus TaxID=1815556 RepID=A0ABV7IJ65_9RHOB|nr:peroxidase-related enzyme [Paracoccus fontiphilus]